MILDFASNPEKDARRARFARRKAKRRDDYNHGKSGYVAGNPRYNGDGSLGVAKPDANHFRQYATSEEWATA